MVAICEINNIFASSTYLLFKLSLEIGRPDLPFCLLLNLRPVAHTRLDGQMYGQTIGFVTLAQFFCRLTQMAVG